MRTCHYDLLGVDRRATPDELKKAYRKKALELHPDKNRDRVEEATSQFADVQQAYEVLSDEQERAWYDSHREAILRGDTDIGGATGSAGSTSHMDITTADVLMRYYSTSCYSGFSDSNSKSFFNIYRDLFKRLEEEEEEAARMDSEALEQDEDVLWDDRTPFGNTNDAYEGQPRDFYNKFLHFSSIKSFRWHDKYRLSDAPDRRVRRLMEKDNKRARDLARREFNDAVRNLAAFIRKRDPRYKLWKEKQEVMTKEKADAENKRRAEERRKERDKRAEEYVVPDWAKVSEGERDAVVEAAQDLEIEELFCVACEKAFRSEKQFENHEKSKKHQRNVELLRQELLEEDGTLGFDDDADDNDSLNDSDLDLDEFVDAPTSPLPASRPSTPPTESADQEVTEEVVDEPVVNEESDEEDVLGSIRQSKASKKKAKRKQARFGLVSEDHPTDPVPTQAFADLTLSPDTPESPEPPNDTPPTEPTTKKLSAKEKRAQRESRKAATLAKEKSAGATVCQVCEEPFTSRTKLFEHIARSGHAVPVPAAGGATEGGKKGKGKR
ncbi:hypothetical protein DFS34DRAFT_207081 [Phlyctochytrium arcticum]|nr:hypothetical protein DFS34DRAFT_207081 [Phlyctochytrium arcticum]